MILSGGGRGNTAPYGAFGNVWIHLDCHGWGAEVGKRGQAGY